MLLVTRRHQRVKAVVRGLLESRGFTCYVEVYALDYGGTSRLADIVAFDNNCDLAYVLDPTVRYETNDESQAEAIAKEKHDIYSKCTGYLQEKYREQHGERRNPCERTIFVFDEAMKKYRVKPLDPEQNEILITGLKNRYCGGKREVMRKTKLDCGKIRQILRRTNKNQESITK